MDLNYEVVVRPNLAELTQSVSKLREKGWACVGGVSYDPVHDRYFQSIQKQMMETTGIDSATPLYVVK